MSIWADYGKGGQPPPNTPEVRIRLSGDGGYMVLVGAEQHAAYYAPSYVECHIWASNQYGLTSTVMLAVYAEYAAFYRDVPVEQAPIPKQNKYRKASI